MALRIGFHPNNLHLSLAARWPGAFADFDPEFVPYQEGRETAAKLAAGAFDIGGTGSTPPILAAASGLSVIYAAGSSPRPANGAILVNRQSEIESLADLKGRSVALVDGSFLTYFLAKGLEEAGFELPDVHRHDLLPVPSRDALRSGAIDAWVAMAPHLEQSLSSGEFRVLAHCGATIPNRSTFWTIRERGLSADVIDGFASELARIGNKIQSDPEKAAALLSENGTEVERRAWTRVVNERDWRVGPASDVILREQQAEADTLFRHKDLATRLEIATNTIAGNSQP
ncbi:ABC transporter substrate-binding protein [Agrobacterium rhizogenes]|uniref:ABC transporter substrate-binding protein n=1 Tax=Rhizobium rhizogenes TaxID=359 RepID=UPI0004DA3B83|nr:ABC transporter substrate-binding protein [Rhizobium rhizogenes]KAA6487765.1 ABC transporter [Agrobacterium sp. ICMP 7243]OCJ23023.1 ABC transporter [Agrobacterium sp. B133/95]KEA08217.1 ABC transporter [Rhizobium rhizogenes]MDJ1635625.1 ABC transporter substrate-binding protein [Rhizobium rhizogenes]MQB31509.1 ABC transporter [Rhizobium rhizogenes]